MIFHDYKPTILGILPGKPHIFSHRSLQLPRWRSGTSLCGLKGHQRKALKQPKMWFRWGLTMKTADLMGLNQRTWRFNGSDEKENGDLIRFNDERWGVSGISRLTGELRGIWWIIANQQWWCHLLHPSKINRNHGGCRSETTYLGPCGDVQY